MIGRLRNRLGIYVPQTTPDAMGGATTQWVFYAHCWADVSPRSGGETQEHGRLAVTQSYRVIIRFREDFPERARLMWKGRILRVVTASDPDNRRERLHLICEEEQQ